MASNTPDILQWLSNPARVSVIYGPHSSETLRLLGIHFTGSRRWLNGERRDMIDIRSKDNRGYVRTFAEERDTLPRGQVHIIEDGLRYVFVGANSALALLEVRRERETDTSAPTS